MSLDKISEAYYTAGEARHVLGLTEAAFQGWVRDKKVTKVILPGRKQGAYLKREINMLAASIDAAILAVKEPVVELKKATLETQSDEFKLAELNFGERTLQFHPYRVELLKRNPDMSYYLYDGRFIVASINIVPMSHEGIELFRQGERGWLMGEYVRPYEAGSPLELVIIDFMTTPLAPAPRRNGYALRLMLKMADQFQIWGSQGIEVSRILACGGTPDGRRILETAQFTYLGEQKPNRHVYELVVEESHLKVLDPYKEALAEYKQMHGGV